MKKLMFITSLLIALIVSLPITLAATQNLIYDANGNLITGDSKYREYNGFNHLVRIRDGNNATGLVLEEYDWHPLEERTLVKHVYENGSWKESIYYPSKDFVRVKNTSGTFDYKYIYQNGQLVAQELVGGQKNFMLNDHKGTVQVVVNESGAKVEETFYSPFGEIISGGTTSRFDYEGKEYDSVVGDYDYHARKYSLLTKTLTTPDPMLPSIYDPQQLNRYAFERDNPTKNIDEEGNFVILPFLVAGAIVGTINTIDYYMTHDNTNLGSAAGYFGAGFVNGALALTGVGGAFVGGWLSKAIENKIDNKDITSGVFGEGAISAISFKFGEYLLPSTKEWLIKKPLSYLTTKTGLTFSTNIAAEEIASRSGAYLGETLRILRQNWNIGNVNQANIYSKPESNSNSGSSRNNGGGGGGSSSGSWYSYDRHIDADAGTTSYTAIRGDNNGYTWSTVTISND